MKGSMILAVLMFASLAATGQATKQNAPPPSVPLPDVAPSCEGITGALPEAITECQKRETARLFIILNRPEAALRVLCSTKVAKDAFAAAGLDCIQETKEKAK
jgi:hypothetical protein